jgi:hypothetical protein
MAIVFPRDLPSGLQLVGRSFELKRDVRVNTRRDGSAQVIERGDPRWHAALQFRAMDRADYQRAYAWWLSLQDGMRDFLLHDSGHARPILYRTGFDGLTRHGGGAFDGTAGVAALAPSTITIDSLPTSFGLVAGDYVGLVEDGAYGLHMVMEDATASAGEVTVAVQPFVKTGIFSSSATVNLERPQARFMPVAGSGQPSSALGLRPFEFKGIQRLV